MDRQKLIQDSYEAAFHKPAGSTDGGPDEPIRQAFFDEILADPARRDKIYGWVGLQGIYMRDAFAKYVTDGGDAAMLKSLLDPSKVTDVLATKQSLAPTLSLIYMGYLIGKGEEHDLHTTNHPEEVPVGSYN